MTRALLRPLATLPVDLLTPDTYVTDGRRLLRVVSELEADRTNGFAALEDCLTLDVRSYSPGEIAAMGLRTVAIAPSASS